LKGDRADRRDRQNAGEGDAPLEQSLSLFEEGTCLIKFCSQLLDKAEQKVIRLQKGADGGPSELPFDAAE
jgi:exodeoxyribonuclease VII small subunit